MYVLGIETSCDETAAAIYADDKGIVAEQVFSQIQLHQQYGGVVPELAARDHIRKLLPMVDVVLAKAHLTAADIGAIAYTRGPGLIGALLVGASVAKSLAFAWQVPAIGVHHMEAHLMAALLEDHQPDYPFLALLVSGGHTQLMAVNAFANYELLGESLDDAVGEAFDKTAKLLGLPYPGGPHLAALAEQGDAQRFQFPRPMTDRPGLDFSFSGLKTAAVHCFKQYGAAAKADIACAFEEAAIDTLLIKSKRALQHTGLNRLVVVGGVSANKKLRIALAAVPNTTVYFPRHDYCTDNAAMVAFTGYLRWRDGFQDADWKIEVKPRWALG